MSLPTFYTSAIDPLLQVVSRELLIHLIDYYVTSYSTNNTIKTFLDTTTVHIMPSMNPDGYSMAIMGQCYGVIGR